jgi:SAM-dependent methyltransferase
MDYIEEAEFAWQTLCQAGSTPIQSLLELGSGGGNNAFHLSRHCSMTLIDISSEMLAISRQLNPGSEHIQADMRTVRLDRVFDAVFIHDAIMYMTAQDDLLQAIRTASVHCRPGGTVLIMPDFIRETFAAGVHHGGYDGEGRALRYIEWTFDPDPSDTTYTVDFLYMLREANAGVRVEHDTHIFGIFSRGEWMQRLNEAGLRSRIVRDPFGREIFVCRREG